VVYVPASQSRGIEPVISSYSYTEYYFVWYYAANPTQIQMEEYTPSVFDLRKLSESENKGEKARGEDCTIIIIIIIIIIFILYHRLLLFM
jgi:hypothetical protein